MFAASGYRAGKVSDVAARIGVTEPVIFQNFGSKAALFAAVLDRLADDVRASLDALTGHHDSAASLLAHILGPGLAPRCRRVRRPAGRTARCSPTRPASSPIPRRARRPRASPASSPGTSPTWCGAGSRTVASAPT